MPRAVTMSCTTRSTLIALSAIAVHAWPVWSQSLETETARPVPKGRVAVGHNFEFQTSPDGTELALPFAVEAGLTNRLELLVEPVTYTAIRPKVGTHATGWGDLEVTVTYLVARETATRPAFALAGEVKVPTARNTLIGTGRPDYAIYLIGSRLFGRVDVHANLGYTIVGQPAGARLSNIFNVAVAAQLPLGRNELFAEALANTASRAGAELPAAPGPSPAVPEAAGGEVVVTLGAARWVASFWKFSASISLDNNGAVLLRPGFELRLH